MASFLRQISMNCLMSDTSRGMTGKTEGFCAICYGAYVEVVWQISALSISEAYRGEDPPLSLSTPRGSVPALRQPYGGISLLSVHVRLLAKYINRSKLSTFTRSCCSLCEGRNIRSIIAHCIRDSGCPRL